MSSAVHPHSDQEHARAVTRRGLFLVGAERSGTTMLRLMLDHHPLIAWQNEFEFAVDCVDDSGKPPSTAAYTEFLNANRIFRATGYRIDPGLPYPELVRSFLHQRGEKKNKDLVGATVHRHIGRLLTIWPEARFVHLVRDPRDVAPSVIRMGWAGNCYHGVEGWEHAERDWDRLAARLEPSRFIELRFEQLLADPESELSRICDFIGVPFDSQMLRFHEDTTYEPPDPSASTRWQGRLDARSISLIEARVGDLLVARGYERAAPEARTPGPATLAALFVQNRVSRIRWRIRRYGLGLYIKAQLTKRFSPRGLWPAVREHMQRIDQERLK